MAAMAVLFFFVSCLLGGLEVVVVFVFSRCSKVCHIFFGRCVFGFKMLIGLLLRY